MTDLFMMRGARLSDCRQYRYRLWRTWDTRLRHITYVMLNPSVADETKDDATITRCIRRAEKLGAGGIIVMNLFAFVSTEPDRLYAAQDPVGPETDTELLEACRDALHVICAWGTHGTHLGRDNEVLKLLRANGIQPQALAFNGDGSPKHPLYVSYDTPLVQMPA